MILTVLSASCAGIIQCLSFCDWLLSLGSVSLLVYCSFPFFLSFLLYISSCVPQCVCGGQRRSELSQFILFFSHGTPRNWTHMVRVWHQVPPTHWAILLFPHFFFFWDSIQSIVCVYCIYPSPNSWAVSTFSLWIVLLWTWLYRPLRLYLILSVLLLVILWVGVSLCCLHCPGICFVDQTGLILRSACLCLPAGAGIKACATTPDSFVLRSRIAGSYGNLIFV